MPIACEPKQRHGASYCTTECPATDVFEAVRVESPAQLPPPDPLAVDVAVLDMNHGWPNLGHEALVHAVLDASCDLKPALARAGLRVRAVSFDVRVKHQLPEPPGGRFALYLATGGPGHLDPHANQEERPGSQGLREDPAWERPLFALLHAVLADEEAALLAVCHTFGVMCRWSGVAEPRLRGPEKGGKSAGVRENVLTEAARRHPWFGRLAAELPEGRRLRILDNRLFDLVPLDAGALDGRRGPLALAFEHGGELPGDALTMLEFALDAGGVMPRVLGVNHHPEIVDRARQLALLDRRRRTNADAVPPGWYDERVEALTHTFADEDTERRLHLTSDFTLLGPLRFHLLRQVRRRAETLGRDPGVHEDSLFAEEDALAAAR